MTDNINNGATVSNPSPTPSVESVIINSAHSGKHIAFERHNMGGVPCIIGNAKKHMTDADRFFMAVFNATGGRTTVLPLPARDKCLYEIHEGDFISVMERVDGTLFVDSYFVKSITDTHIQAIHAIL